MWDLGTDLQELLFLNEVRLTYCDVRDMRDVQFRDFLNPSRKHARETLLRPFLMEAGLHRATFGSEIWQLTKMARTATGGSSCQPY